MKSAIKSSCCIILALVLVESIRATDWRGITPLHSNRADVEKILGPPYGLCDSSCHYLREDVFVTITYSSPPCEANTKDRSKQWDVPSDIVVDIWVDFRGGNGPRFSTMGLDLSKYSKRRDVELGDMYYYENNAEGVTIQMDQNFDKVRAYYYYPALKDNHLRCPPSKR